MNNDHLAINIAIAKAMGETWERLPASAWPYRWKRNGVIVVPQIRPADYCSDLNAMHKAERWLFQGGGSLQQYVNRLRLVLGQFPEYATAAQRAEAFLYTLGISVK